MYLTESYQNPKGMIAGSREEINEGSDSRKRETVQPISQKLETPLQIAGCSRQAICGIIKKKKKRCFQFQISRSCSSVNPKQSLLTIV